MPRKPLSFAGSMYAIVRTGGKQLKVAAGDVVRIEKPAGEKLAKGESLALSVEEPAAPRTLMEGIVKTAAGVFGAAASSIALQDRTTGELVYQSAWGAGAHEIVGVRLPPGAGIAGIVVESGEPSGQMPNSRN